MKEPKLTIGYLENISPNTNLNNTIDDKLSDNYMKMLLKKRGIKVKTVKAKDVSSSKLPFIFVGFNTPGKLYLFKSLEKWMKLWESNRNLSASMKMMRYIANKCKYLSELKRKKIPVIPTKCYKLSKIKPQTISKMKYKFLKPNPGGWGRSTMTLGNHSNVSIVAKYLHQLKSSHAENVMVQPWLQNFATNKNPEKRLFFYRKNGKHYFHHGAATKLAGYFKSAIRTIPKEVEQHCLKMGKIMEKKFGPIFYYRCDWTRHKGKMLLNELEFFPGINYHEIQPLAKKYFEHIADEIVNVARKKSNNSNGKARKS